MGCMKERKKGQSDRDWDDFAQVLLKVRLVFPAFVGSCTQKTSQVLAPEFVL